MTARNTALHTHTHLTHAPLQYVVQQPRTPKVFYGEPYEVVEDWVDHFEWAAAFQVWDNDRIRRNVFYYLHEGARTWFENHELTLSSGEEFRQRLHASFRSSDHKANAEAALQARNQRQNVSATKYTEDMVRLFRSAYFAMTDDKKTLHLMCFKQDIFAGLIRSLSKTAAEFVSESTAIEKALHQRSGQ
ncbi:hypothetical protein HPB48_023585 [Haemaphysalis longicornis]|uniref:Retrotransposon gag domain-containing protein n=1 Tax=Haemaphysalis longicornis TaxID=44386 RepID=A0A9J6H5F9_HAELO|nr:hypothetical protein HPB48_023585 [Haemaphysalis longicornis]